MALLLNWRVWCAVLVLTLEAYGSYVMYTKGEEHIQIEFDVYKNQQIVNALAQERLNRSKEVLLNTENQKVTDNYESLKTATSTAVKSLDSDRMRLQALIAAGDRSTPTYTGAGLQPVATPKDRVLSECLGRYEEVAGDADALSDQVRAFQDYITGVVLN